MDWMKDDMSDYLFGVILVLPNALLVLHFVPVLSNTSLLFTYQTCIIYYQGNSNNTNSNNNNNVEIIMLTLLPSGPWSPPPLPIRALLPSGCHC
jgi:hypothetical protein